MPEPMADPAQAEAQQIAEQVRACRIVSWGPMESPEIAWTNDAEAILARALTDARRAVWEEAAKHVEMRCRASSFRNVIEGGKNLASELRQRASAEGHHEA